MNPLRTWLRAATPEQRKRLLELTGLTPGSLHQMAGAYPSGGELRLTPATAGLIESATVTMSREYGTPVLHRRDLSPACGVCPHARGAGPTPCAARR